MLNVVKKEKPGPSKATRLTQVHGSLIGKAILSKIKQLNEEKKRKEDAAMTKKLLKEKKVTVFIRCEIRCVCEEDQLIAGKCAADGLRKCSVCGSILKGDCTKKNCKNAGRTSLYPASSSKRGKIRDIADAEDNGEEEIIKFYDIDLTIDITDNELYA